MKLFEISNDFEELFNQLESFEEIEDPEEREIATGAWFDTLDGMESEFDRKAENVAQYIKELRAESDAIREEEKVLAARRKSKEKRSESLTAYLMNCMEQIHRDKIETARCKLSIRRNAPSLKIADESAFIHMLQDRNRDDLLKYALPEIKKSEVKKLIKAGEEFPGAALESSQSLIIK